MYTILLNEDNHLKTTVRDRIMHNSNLVDILRFLVYPTYNDLDMSEFDVKLKYLLPSDKKERTITLSLSKDRYKDYLQYYLPIDTELTSEVGEVKLRLTFSFKSASGNKAVYIRETSPTMLEISPVDKFDVIEPDSPTPPGDSSGDSSEDTSGGSADNTCTDGVKVVEF